jgi:hypothetical protein
VTPVVVGFDRGAPESKTEQSEIATIALDGLRRDVNVHRGQRASRRTNGEKHV